MPNLKAYKEKKLICPEAPHTLFIEPTNCCNLACVFCPNRIQTRTREYMSMPLFRFILNEAKEAGVKKINLFFLGESLLHPQIFKMLGLIRESGIHCRLNTNATLLTRSRAKKLITNPPDELTISFDGATKEIYEKLREKGSYQQTKENIQHLLETRATSSIPFQINIEMIETPETAAHFDSFEAEMKKFHPDTITRKTFRNWLGTIEGQSQPETPKYICSYPWKAMAVLVDGTAVPCCVDYDGRFPLGHITEGLMELWNGEEMTHLRKYLIETQEKGLDHECECHQLCGQCDIANQDGEHS
jgi:radical SAM protein with 4Fe4S-binding SPASM domain